MIFFPMIAKVDSPEPTKDLYTLAGEVSGYMTARRNIGLDLGVKVRDRIVKYFMDLSLDTSFSKSQSEELINIIKTIKDREVIVNIVLLLQSYFSSESEKAVKAFNLSDNLPIDLAIQRKVLGGWPINLYSDWSTVKVSSKLHLPLARQWWIRKRGL